jgi:hypothetical protein
VGAGADVDPRLVVAAAEVRVVEKAEDAGVGAIAVPCREPGRTAGKRVDLLRD